MEQLSVFDLLCESKPLPSKIKLLSLFSGIGAFEKALDKERRNISTIERLLDSDSCDVFIREV